MREAWRMTKSEWVPAYTKTYFPTRFGGHVKRFIHRRTMPTGEAIRTVSTGQWSMDLEGVYPDGVHYKPDQTTYYGSSPTDVVRQAHEAIVKKALAEGRPVPPRVLAGYPHLTERGTMASRTNPESKTYYLGYYHDGRQLVGQLSDDLDAMSPEIVIDPPMVEFLADSHREAVARAMAELDPMADLEINTSMKYKYIPLRSEMAR